MTSLPPAEPLGTCRRCGTEIPPGSPYCPECGLVQSAPAPAYRPRPRRQRPAWVVPALIAGALASLAAGALLAVALDGRRDTAVGDPSPTPSASVSDTTSASAEPEESESPTPSPTPTASIIPNRGIAQVLTESAVLRANPNDTAAVLAELGAGRRLFVVGEPEESGEQRWYRVGTLDESGCDDDCRLIGWVGTPIADDGAVIEAADVSCPSSPMTADQLASVPPLEALHCYGRSELTITGVVGRREVDEDAPLSYTPGWLAEPMPELFIGSGLGYHPLPDADLEEPEEGAEVRVRGHFEDPAATSCRVSASADAGEVTLPQPARVVLDCRATFVWTEIDILD